MDKSSNMIVTSTRIRLARNISGVPFPNKLAKDSPCIGQISKAVLDTAQKVFGDAELINMADISQMEAFAMVESHLISKELLYNTESGAVVLADGRKLSVMLNEEDHIRAQYIVDGLNIAQSYDIISKFDDELSKTLKFAFDEKLGYLTACPTNLGTGMRASIMAFLPALSIEKAIGGIIKFANTAGFTVRGIYGEGSKSEGLMYQISNQKTLGVSEEIIIERVSKIVAELERAENESRATLVEKYGVQLEDKIMRYYGELKYAKVLSSQEFADKIGYIKLGVVLGYFDNSIKELDDLIVSVQPAIISRQMDYNKADSCERDIERANIVRLALDK